MVTWWTLRLITSLAVGLNPDVIVERLVGKTMTQQERDVELLWRSCPVLYNSRRS